MDDPYAFQADPQLEADTVLIADWHLCQVRLMNDSRYPWVILVPKVPGVEEIHQLAGDSTPEGQKLKAQRLFDAGDATEKVRRVADVCLGAFFAEPSENARLDTRQMREQAVDAWLRGDPESGELVGEWSDEIRGKHAPFHWLLEFPEVFYEARPDPLADGELDGAACMDGFIGNPPFMGGGLISGAISPVYLDWLLALHPEAPGKADLVSHFLLRCGELAGLRGSVGLISTNTVSQGDTRKAGLARLLTLGWQVFNAQRNCPWPGSAAVVITILHLWRGEHRLPSRLDGKPVEHINSHLRRWKERLEAHSLASNMGFYSKGVDVGGAGFVLEAAQANDYVRREPQSVERLRTFVGGADVNSDPNQTSERMAIDFGRLELSDCQKWFLLLSHVEENVRAARMTLRDTPINRRLKKYWWRYWADRPALQEALAPLERCLVTAQVTKHLCFSFQPTDRLLNNKLYVFPFDTFTPFAILQSRIHEAWVRLLSSTMKTDLNYSASECFKTFPFPLVDPKEPIAALEAAGGKLYEARAQFMLDTSQGLTATYNALKDPGSDDERILELRRMHEELDRAVCDAYGWSGVVVPPYCPMSEEDEVVQAAFADDIIDRLYVLNAERAAEEKRQGLDAKSAAKTSTSKKSKRKADSTMSLPGMGDAKDVR